MSFHVMKDLAKSGAIPPASFLPLIAVFRNDKRWARRFFSFFLFISISSLCASFLFLAHRYFYQLSTNVKLIVSETGLALCLFFLAFKKNPTILQKRLSLFAAFGLIGLLLFIERPIFAHSYLLFLLWGFFSLPLLFVSFRQSFLGVLIVLFNTAFLLLGMQSVLPNGLMLWTTFFSILSLLNFICFYLIQRFAPRFRLIGYFSFLFSLCFVFLPALHLILNVSFYQTYSAAYFIAPVLFCAYTPFWYSGKLSLFRTGFIFSLFILIALALRFLSPFIGGGYPS